MASWLIAVAWLHATSDAVPSYVPVQLAGCLSMATVHDEACCRVPLAQCGRLSSLTQEMLTSCKVGFLSRRTGPPTKESKRGAASERSPLSSATTAVKKRR